ncbi:MAG: regulatory iron-sulfur-containing complex subunit RicT [Patescibacteria group bacterium]
MKAALIQFTPWDKAYYFDPASLELAENDYVIVETQLGTEMGKVIGFEEVAPVDGESREIKPVARKATMEDLEQRVKLDKEKEEALKNCKKIIDRYNLPMKLVDVHFSFDNKRLTFAFIANGRVDFRQLVKDLTRHYQKNIRLQQIGIRDEMKMQGDVGPCGRRLCCQQFVKDLGNITSELAETQQVAHRGSDRLSGNCGRLRCCLAFEQPTYEEFAKSLPLVGSIVKTESGKGQVIGWHTLKQTVDVRLFPDKEVKEGTIVEIAADKLKVVEK